MILIENAPLVSATVPSDEEDGRGVGVNGHASASSSSVEVGAGADAGLVFAVTSNAHVQRANAAYVSSPLSLRRSVARERKVVHVLQNETASVEFRADSCVLASDDATTCVIAVVVCQATGMASVCHFDEVTSGSDACFRKFMSQHVGGGHCAYDAYLVGGMVEETLVGLRTATNLLARMHRSPGTFNLRLCCVYDQNTCGQTGCPLVRSLAVDPLTSTAYHVSTSTANLGLASLRRNHSQQNLDTLVAQQQQQQAERERGREVRGEKEAGGAAMATTEGGEEKPREAAPPPPFAPRPTSPPVTGWWKTGALGLTAGSPLLPPPRQRGPGLERRLAHFWLAGFPDAAPDLVTVYDIWEQRYVLPGGLHAVPRWLLVDSACLLTLSDEQLLTRTSTTPQCESETFCSDVRKALTFILKHHAGSAEPTFALYTQSYTWDYAGSAWVEVDDFGAKKTKGLAVGVGAGLAPGLGAGQGVGVGAAAPHSDLPRVDVPGSSWSTHSLVDREEEALRA